MLFPQPDTGPQYRPEIDGLRGIAVIGVLLYHLDLGFSGGYVGVDVFFVISGFLITRLMLELRRRGALTLTGFWARRVRRLFPALAVVLVFTLIAGWRWFLPEDFQEYARSLAAQSTLTSNVFFWLNAGYFDTATDVKPLLHTWSLAIEEQFYLLFPFLFLARKNIHQSTLVAAMSAIVAGSLALSVYGSYWHPSAAFYLLPSRAWELALGSLVCLVGAGAWASSGIRRPASWLGIAAIGYALVSYSGATRFPGAAALLPCGGTAMLIWATTGSTGAVSRALSWRPLVFVGLISYSLYLWHWPLIVFWKYMQPVPALPVTDKLALAAVSFAAASASYYFVESPIRHRHVLKSTSHLVWSSLAALLAFFAVGSAVYSQHGLSARLPEVCVQLATADVDPIMFTQTSVDDLRQWNVPLLAGTRDASGPQRVDILLWGDSHANSVAPLLRSLAAEHRLTFTMIVHPSTAPLLDYSAAFPYSLQGSDALEFSSRTIEYIRGHTVRAVVLAAAWEAYASEGGTSPAPLVTDASLHTFGQRLASTVNAVHGAGAEVWVLKDVPSIGFDVPRALSRVCIANGDRTSLQPSADVSLSNHAAVNRAIDVVQSARVHVLDPLPLFTDGNRRVLIERESRALFMDNAHLTTQGAQLLRPLFETVLELTSPHKTTAVTTGRK